MSQHKKKAKQHRKEVRAERERLKKIRWIQKPYISPKEEYTLIYSDDITKIPKIS